MRGPAPIVLASLICVTAACTWGPGSDAQSTRCLEALRFRLPGSRVKVLDADLDASSRSVSVRFEAEAGPLVEPLRSRITCRHADGDRWSLESVHIGDERLSEAAVTLVNAELFLRDLRENRERFTGGSG